VGKPVSYPLPAHPVVLFGDSITEGYGATDRCLPLYVRSILPESKYVLHSGDTSYPGDLARLLHASVLNYGVGKELTSDGLPRLRSLVRTVHPSTVVILEGINDLWGNGSVADITGNLSRMARAVKASGGRPLLLTVLPVDRPVFPDARSKVSALNSAIRTMAKRQGVTLVDVASQFQSQHPLATLFRHSNGREDGVHPNDSGYWLSAKSVELGLMSR
jgi:lysophospholipase L1-like esterase